MEHVKETIGQMVTHQFPLRTQLTNDTIFSMNGQKIHEPINSEERNLPTNPLGYCLNFRCDSFTVGERISSNLWIPCQAFLSVRVSRTEAGC